ncbi:MAG TPA: TlpA disulfide reductase family protein [Bryobacteraceae bacterium]|nr:TlpA disulfide reductase family protein [Bryobacteraceae bacterium]
MLAVGATAPDFGLPEFGNGPVLLAFFKISCPTCQLAFPFLQRMADTNGPRIVAISQDDQVGTDQFRRRFGISLETVLDPGPVYRASKLYGISSVPSLFLVEGDGRISLASAGFSREDFESLGGRFGVEVFKPGENVPFFRPG